MTAICFTVPFVMGMPRPRVTRHGAYTPAKAVEAKVAVRRAFETAWDGPVPAFGEHEPVVVSITTYRSLPPSRPKRVESEPDTYKPDADNVAKLVQDALNGLAWADDAQVSVLLVRKADRTRDRDHECTEVQIKGVDE